MSGDTRALIAEGLALARQGVKVAFLLAFVASGPASTAAAGSGGMGLAALAGLVLAWPEARRRLWLWGGLAVFGLLVALGAYTVVHGWLTLILPFFDQLRAPARALVLWALGMGVLSAVGFEAFAQRLARARFLDRFLQVGALLLALATAMPTTAVP